MSECKHLKECEFVLRYVKKVKPHWDDFVNLYCKGDFQPLCKRLQGFEAGRSKPRPELMPTGHFVPEIVIHD